MPASSPAGACLRTRAPLHRSACHSCSAVTRRRNESGCRMGPAESMRADALTDRSPAYRSRTASASWYQRIDRGPIGTHAELGCDAATMQRLCVLVQHTQQHQPRPSWACTHAAQAGHTSRQRGPSQSIMQCGRAELSQHTAISQRSTHPFSWLKEASSRVPCGASRPAAVDPCAVAVSGHDTRPGLTIRAMPVPLDRTPSPPAPGCRVASPAGPTSATPPPRIPAPGVGRGLGDPQPPPGLRRDGFAGVAGLAKERPVLCAVLGFEAVLCPVHFRPLGGDRKSAGAAADAAGGDWGRCGGAGALRPAVHVANSRSTN